MWQEWVKQFRAPYFSAYSLIFIFKQISKRCIIDQKKQFILLFNRKDEMRFVSGNHVMASLFILIVFFKNSWKNFRINKKNPII